mgnify:CR=1 FL=1|jgi:hypothetical protein
MDLIFFLRYYFFGGTKDRLVALKKWEIDRKIKDNEPFDNRTAFQGTKVPSLSKDLELAVWGFIGEDVSMKLGLYPCSYEATLETIANGVNEAFGNGVKPAAD